MAKALWIFQTRQAKKTSGIIPANEPGISQTVPEGLTMPPTNMTTEELRVSLDESQDPTKWHPIYGVNQPGYPAEINHGWKIHIFVDFESVMFHHQRVPSGKSTKSELENHQL